MAPAERCEQPGIDVVLSTPGPGDAAEFIAEVRASRELHRPWIDPPDTPQRFDAYLQRINRIDYDGYLLRHAECGGLVGFVNVNNIVRGGFQSAYLGYAAFSSHAGRGLMTAGLGAALNAAFGELALHRVEANIQPNNKPSIALVRRLGFEREGFSPDYLLVDGRWRDHERWALLARHWMTR